MKNPNLDPKPKPKVHLTQDTLNKLEAENDIEEAIGFMDDEDLQANDFWHQNPGKKRDTGSATQ